MSENIFIQDINGKYINFYGRKSAEKNFLLNETIWKVPDFLGKGFFKNYKLKSGIEISFSNCSFNKVYNAKINHEQPKITFAFNLSGKTLTENSFLKKEFLTKGDDSYVHYFEDPVIKRKTSPDEKLQALVIRITSEDLIKIIGDEYFSGTENLFSFTNGHLANFMATHKTTPEMKAVIFQMQNSTHRGIVKKIFLESKALELIAYKIEQASGFIKNIKPDKTEKDLIFHARKILLEDIKNPPSLLLIAEKTGVSHTKLNRGFKNIFGCTAFELLRKERLAYSKKLLKNKKLSITEIAFESGFCSSSHFAFSFFKEFGIRPKDFRG